MTDRSERFPPGLQRVALELLGARPRTLPTTEHSDSMRPLLRPGERILVRFGHRGRPRIGEVWVYDAGPNRVVHRFLGRGPSRSGICLRFRGDNRPTFDAPVDPEELRGRVVAIERSGQWWGLEQRRARLYAAAVALHACFWGAANAFAERIALAAGESPGSSPVVLTLRRIDRRLLHALDRLLFRACHPRLPALAADPGPADGR